MIDDLDWMARNVHKWGGWNQSWCYVGTRPDGTKTVTLSKTSYPDATEVNCVDWLARRAELQNKPSWDQHSWTQIFQNEDGHWFGARDGWDFYAHIGSGWKGDSVSLLRDDGEYLQTGTILGDWRDTLEKRPDMYKSEPEIDTSAEHVQKAPKFRHDFEPLVSVEDAVNSPSHYASGEIECIEAIKASMSPEAFRGYLKGNVQKYLWRYEKKMNPAQDLEKAAWYLSRLIKEL